MWNQKRQAAQIAERTRARPPVQPVPPRQPAPGGGGRTIALAPGPASPVQSDPRRDATNPAGDDGQRKAQDDWDNAVPDPSIAVARKAGVNTALFGGALQVGIPMRQLAACPRTSAGAGHFDDLGAMFGMLPDVPSTCWGHSMIADMLGGVAIDLPRNRRPPWASMFLGFVERGVLVRLMIMANPTGDIVEQVAAKFGKPTRHEPASTEWSLPGLHILHVRPTGQPGRLGITDQYAGVIPMVAEALGQAAQAASAGGLLMFETATAHEAAQTQKAQEPKL